MATTPPTIDPAPTPAPQRGDRATFSSRVDAFVTWLTAAVAQFGAVATNVYANAVDAFNQAVAAAASAVSSATSATQAQQYAAGAAASAGATVWNSATAYAQYAAVFDPTPGVLRAYRHTTTSGASATPPSADPTNWSMELPTLLPYLHVQDRKASGVSGATLTTSSQNNRELQTVIGTNSIPGSSLTANQVTLPAGTYQVLGWAAFSPNSAAQSNLYNVTDAAVLLLSSANNSNSTGPQNIEGRFTLTAAKVIALRTFAGPGGTPKAGEPVSSGLNEVYASLIFTKVA